MTNVPHAAIADTLNRTRLIIDAAQQVRASGGPHSCLPRTLRRSGQSGIQLARHGRRHPALQSPLGECARPPWRTA